VTAVLWRRLVAEFTGTALLVAVVVGSGIAASRLSPSDVGLQLLENSTVTAFGLTVLILAFGPVSGAHFNPVVTIADWSLSQRSPGGLKAADLLPYVAAQTAGAIGGAVLADVMFDVRAVRWSTHDRSDGHLLVGEVVATAGLVFLIFSLARSGKANLSAPAVGAYIGAAYWFTSSTSFANPAVTVGRAFTNTFAGIEPASVPGFIAAQIVGGFVGLGLLVALYPQAGRGAEQAVLPHTETAAVTAVSAGSVIPT
jgi:arsenate reductase